MAGFTVDTNLFRELGELLVGRSSTALVELIKNAYDADATRVQVAATNLADPEVGEITVVDDGVGMTEREFRTGFLRIAGRQKQEGDRRSIRFRRRFTGAKGIGRLAAHKLARELHVASIPGAEKLDRSSEYQVRATIDWDAVEAKPTLDEADSAITVRTGRTTAAAGTTIRLRRLRRAWTNHERRTFYTEIATFRPPAALSEQLAKSIAGGPLLFEAPRVRDRRARDPGFEVVLEGELDVGDDPWLEFAEASNWILEVDAEPTGVTYAVAPTRKLHAEKPELRKRTARVPHPSRDDGPFFQARVFIREGSPPSSMRTQIRAAAGVRVYMEGFRVLPYGEPGNDWLSVSRDYNVRTPGLNISSDRFGTEAWNEGFTRPTNEQLYGAVFLLERRSHTLRMLVNREGFVPEAGYEHLVTIMRDGVNFSTRVRAAATEAERRKKARQRRSGAANGVEGREMDESLLRAAQTALEESLSRAADAATVAERAAARGDVAEARRSLAVVTKELSRSSSATEELSAEQGLLRVVASVGTQMAAFIHELNRILENVAALETLIEREGTPRLRRLVGDVRRSLERQASYLIDVIGPDTRRRRSRQRIADRVEVGWRFVADAAAARAIELEVEVDPALKTPPMFPAETAAVFTNLLSNAVKAAGRKGRIRVAASSRADRGPVIRIENSGRAVDLARSERWFQPFESTTTQVDPILGQGLGLGLPITRELLAQYGAELSFVKPQSGFKTAIEIRFP